MKQEARPGDADRTAPPERRRAPRHRSRALVDGRAGGLGFLGSTVDLSLGGALIRTYEPLAVGQEAELVLRLPEGDATLAATVVRVTTDSVGCSLVAVRFATPLGAAEAPLAAHLAAYTKLRFAPLSDLRAETPIAVIGVTGGRRPTPLRK
jgi:hypothetical protein